MAWRTPLILVVLTVSLVGCIGRPFAPQPETLTSFQSRSASQTYDSVRVTTAVPSPEETLKLFDLDLYARGIQPVWLEVENGSADRLRFAPTGLDREYFSPLEVSYMLRGGRSNAARDAMDIYLHDSAMPRRIMAGETASGFVFTHSSPGTKVYSIDLFDGKGDGYFSTFFIEVPGFIPDHAEIDITKLSPVEQQRNLDLDEFKLQVYEQPLRADTQHKLNSGRPLNLMLVGDPEDLMHALLRSGWYEISRPSSAADMAKAQFLNTRVADAMFRKRRQGKADRNELMLWHSPMTLEGKPVWWAQSNQFFSDWLGQSVLDPDVDDATAYLLQDLWYSQGLKAYALVTGRPFEGDEGNFFVTSFFTSGLRAVLWLSADPVSMLATKRINFDPAAEVRP